MKNIKKHIVLITSLLLSTLVYSQKEANNWFFGTRAGMTWNSTRSFQGLGVAGTADAVLYDLPIDIPSSSISINTHEGCFSLSDKDGNLLFYSDGMTIWNKNHVVMENGAGLTGHNSSSQSGIIIPYPANPDKYIAVSINYNCDNKLACSVIDMTANGGLGAVTTKNILLTNGLGGIGESLSAIRHANGKDYWIVAPGKGSITYLNTWLVTDAGIQATTPQVLALPTGVLINHCSATGYFKFTPDGKHFIWTANAGGTKHALYGNFDSKTGIFSDVKSVGIHAYGSEFSNSGKYLFTCDGTKTLNVYDFEKLLTTGTLSVKTITMINNGGALQMGPDGRMYIASYSARDLTVITNPEEFNDLKVYRLANFLSGTANLGLPSFSASWFAIKGDDAVCMDKEAEFQTSISGGNVAYITWIFGDGSEIVKQDTSPGISTYTQKHKFSHPGHYTIKIRFYNSSDELQRELTTEINISSCILPVNPNIHHQYKQ